MDTDEVVTENGKGIQFKAEMGEYAVTHASTASDRESHASMVKSQLNPPPCAEGS